MKLLKNFLLLIVICSLQSIKLNAQVFGTKKYSNKKDTIVAPIVPRGVKPNNKQWETKASFPGPHRNTSISFVINGKAYVGTGITGNTLYDDIWEYDFATDIWTQKANFPGGGRRSACAFSINGKGYITKGMNWSGAYDDIWEYDPTNDTWLQKTGNPANGVYGAACFTIGTKAYIYGGQDGSSNYRSDFWEYDMLTDVWALKFAPVDNPLDSRRADGLGFTINGKGYLIAGLRKEPQSNSPFNCTSVWEYDPTTNVWTIKSNFSTISRIHTTGFVLNGKGYLMTGSFSNSDLNDVWEYNASSNTWVQKLNVGTTGRYAAVAFASTTNGYLLFGNGSTELLKFNP
jgi:N-acetylneuraminic acid mutarotase